MEDTQNVVVNVVEMLDYEVWTIELVNFVRQKA